MAVESLAPPALSETPEGVKSSVFVEPEIGKGEWVEFKKNNTNEWHPAMVELGSPSGLELRVFARRCAPLRYESVLHENDPRLLDRFRSPDTGVWRIAPREQARRDYLAHLEARVRAVEEDAVALKKRKGNSAGNG